MGLLTRVAKQFLLHRSPVKASHIEPSLLFSAWDEPSRPDPYLLDLALQAVQQARSVSLDDISVRIAGTKYPEVWP